MRSWPLVCAGEVPLPILHGTTCPSDRRSPCIGIERSTRIRVVYFDDMYVDAKLSLETARDVGNVQAWVTNEFEHDGVRQSSAVFSRLRQMVRERGGPLLEPACSLVGN